MAAPKNLTPLPLDQVHQTCQVLIAYLSDGRNSTPNDMLNGVVSGRSLLKGILSGQLVVCQASPESPKKAPPAPADPPEVETAEREECGSPPADDID